MAKASKGYILKKGSIRLHLKGFSGVRESFLPDIFNKQRQEIRTGDNNGILGSLNSSVGLLTINLTQ